MTRKEENYQRILIGILSVILALTGSYYMEQILEKHETVSARIADEIVRFHVIPDHDSEADERLKELVRNDMLEFLAYKQEKIKAEGRDTKEEFIKEVENSLTQMELLGKSRVLTEGFSYEVDVTCENTYFPQKVFGEYVFPEGRYDAINVFIGRAKGSNWWGVMYPNLCLVEGTYDVFSEEADGILQEHLLAEDYKNLLTAPREKVHVKCRAYELIQEFLKE